jgi:IclR family pca regulon transcriptional regulator
VNKPDREFVTSVARVFDVIRSFDEENAELTLAQVASRSGLSAATARRFLLTLMHLGYVGHKDRRFFLRPKILAIGSAYLEAGRIGELIVPILREVVSQVGHSCSLGILEGTDIIYVANFSATRQVRLSTGIGSRFPAHAVSIGQVLLASLPEAKLAEYFEHAQIIRFTSATLVDEAKIRERIEQIRRDGYCVAMDELEYGLGALAVPVRLDDGQVVASVNCAAFMPKLSRSEIIETRLVPLQAAADQITSIVRRIPSLLHSFL